ncbi:hypothetical protein TorRG33x02_191630 [Trema orientale]|uniref:Uncharacterized protein n=1 Tax=Trema orientale TaxID=63057 RepID=A0A2P5EHT3_TREOI|nr:hypothetical protein TorRG33x02_191630 [Trema orientale]
MPSFRTEEVEELVVDALNQNVFSAPWLLLLVLMLILVKPHGNKHAPACTVLKHYVENLIICCSILDPPTKKIEQEFLICIQVALYSCI